MTIKKTKVPMSNVTLLNAKCLTPAMVMEKVTEQLDGVTEVFIVTNNVEGGFSLFASGDLSKLAEASLYMSHYASLKARGEIDTE